MQLYFFSGDDLELKHKMPRKFKIFDAIGNAGYILMAMDDKNI